MAMQYQNRIPGDRVNEFGILTSRCREMADVTVQRHPVTVSLAVFGVGLGIGAIVGSFLAESRVARDRRLAEGLGSRMLHSLERIVPERLRS